MWHTLSTYQVEKKLNTNILKGLSNREILKRRKEYGINKLDEVKKKSIILKFFNQFKDFMIIVLLFAAGISAIISYIEKTNDYIDSFIIVAIVIFNAIIGLIQERKAEKSLEALKKLSSPTSKVKRDSKIMIIPSSELVPGDIIYLESGNLISADCRLIDTYNFKVEESSLTGETVPTQKNAKLLLTPKIPIGDTFNMAFATTIVTSGHSCAIVTDIGMNTKVGKIAKMIITDEEKETPLQKKLADVGKKLGIACLIICILIFIIGIFKKNSFLNMFMTSVGLGVAAIPEGLPAIVTILLSIGVTKMAKKNAIIRKLPAVETLGNSSIICSDKTGTLTENKMKVVKVLDYSSTPLLSSSSTYNLTCELACMCNDSYLQKDGKKFSVVGEPTENALVELALNNNIFKNTLESRKKRINEIPFESSRKMMTTIHKLENGYFRYITKGAPDVLITKCDKILKDGKICDLTKKDIETIINNNENMASNALRVLGLAYNDTKFLPDSINTNTIEKNLIFVSLIGLIDPPRKGVKDAILTCKKAGIKVAMITGDHILTAKSIAKELGIFTSNDLAITGNEIDKISDKKFDKDILNYSVFARVSPEHKVKIVKAFQKTGAVVAMTGDGVNDAPALKCADIGISMGQNGTDVAKNASDIVLTDDNFVTIVDAVKEGRHIYDNIKKAVHFLLSTNIGEIVTIFLGLLLGLDTPLLAIHLLWINLVTDSLPAIALGMEKTDKYIMYKKPTYSKKGLFSNGLWKKIIFEGIMIGILTLFSFNLANTLFNLEVARTMAFLTLGFCELIHSFNIRSDSSIFEIGIFSNKYLTFALIAGILLQTLVVVIPSIAKIFNVVVLTNIQWLYTITISLMPLIIIEMKKKFSEIIFGKVIYTMTNNSKIKAKA
ncbi:MAG: calcium-translocating P-type ATPase, PMCA-type [Clostridia bacterium]